MSENCVHIIVICFQVVSVSRTPGHTKHFQTIFLTKSVKLCDSPGLVFPSLIPRAMQVPFVENLSCDWSGYCILRSQRHSRTVFVFWIQVLAGIYPIAQVREPYTAVAFLAQRLDIPKLLRLSHPDPEDGAGEWSAMDVCEGTRLVLYISFFLRLRCSTLINHYFYQLFISFWMGPQVLQPKRTEISAVTCSFLWSKLELFSVMAIKPWKLNIFYSFWSTYLSFVDEEAFSAENKQFFTRESLKKWVKRLIL